MPRPTRDPAARRRDAAMLRLRRAKQALTALSLLGAGIVGTAAARTFPGHSSRHTEVATRADAGTERSGASRTTRHRTTTLTPHARHRVHDARPQRPRSHRHATATTQTSTSTTQATTSSPAPPATTPAPASSAPAPVTSGGS